MKQQARFSEIGTKGMYTRMFQLVIAAAWWAASTPASATQYHDLKAISQAAIAFVLAQPQADKAQLEAQAGRLDSRLRLSACDQPLETFLPPGGNPGAARVTVGVRCSDDNPWSIYVPVSVRRYAQVLVAQRALPRGTALTADDVTLKRMDVSRLNTLYLSQANHATGKVLKRAVGAGQVLTANALASPKLVKRGQRVIILASSDRLMIRASGTALGAGGVGDRVRVRNRVTKKVVEGTISSDGTVEVGL